MLEFRDGEFSENMDIERAMAKFQNALEEDPFNLKALHVGTPEELDDIRKRPTFKLDEESQDLQSQIDDLKEQVKELKPVKSQYIHIPTDQERKVLKDIMDAGKKKETVFLFD